MLTRSASPLEVSEVNGKTGVIGKTDDGVKPALTRSNLFTGP